MATTTERREKRVVQIAEAALTVDINTGEIMEEKATPSPVPAKKPTEKLPYNAVIVNGAVCPECGSRVARARMNGKVFEVCTKQFAEEPECWYAREIPKDGEAKADGSSDDESHDETGERFEDGGADLGGAQMKTATKNEGDATDGDPPSGKTSKKGKGKK